MEFKNKLDRYSFYAKKKLDIIYYGLTPSRIKGRFSGPKVVLNSLPKSGTHLIETLFFELPYIRHFGGRTIMMNNHDDSFMKLDILRNLRRGQFAPAHIQYNDSIYEYLVQNDVKIIQMIRDPRDVLISNWLYVKELDKTHQAHQFIKGLSSDIDQFSAVIDGKEDVIEPFQEVAYKFYGWTTKSHVLTLRFEDLVGEKGGGSNSVQLSAIHKILDHINLTLPNAQINDLQQKVFSTKSSTFNTGKINKWKVVFTEEYKNICKEKIQNILELYGYESDTNW